MRSHGSLLRVSSKASKPIALRIARAILIPGLVVASLGATAAAAPGHDHIRTHSKASCRAEFVPWMFGAGHKLGVPWMYTTSGAAWMSPDSRVPWMYGPDSRVPWMYGPCRSTAVSPARRAAVGTRQ
jgi:hypothetical protein